MSMLPTMAVTMPMRAFHSCAPSPDPGLLLEAKLASASVEEVEVAPRWVGWLMPEVVQEAYQHMSSVIRAYTIEQRLIVLEDESMPV